MYMHKIDYIPDLENSEMPLVLTRGHTEVCAAFTAIPVQWMSLGTHYIYC